MRKKNLILSILTVLFANIVYFIWMPYPKSFLKTAGSSTFLFDLLTNLIFFAAFAMILLVSVNAVTRPGTILTKSKIPAAIATCIAMQLGFDFLKFAAERLLRWWAPLSNDFLTVLGLLVLALIVIKLLKVSSVNWKRFYAVFLPTAVIMLAVFFVLDVQDILHVQHASEKYVFDLFDTELTHEANAIAANTQFLYEIRNAILDFLTCAAIMIALYFSAVSRNIEDNEEYHTKEAHFVTRIAVVILLSFVVCGIKMVSIPHNSIKNTRALQSHSESTLPVFDYNRTQVTHSRATGYGGVSKLVYNATHSYILYSNEIILEFDMDRECESLVLEKIDTNGTECYVACYDKAIAYLKDGTPYAVEIKDVVNKEYDALLLRICEKLLEEKRLSCFDYIGEYILKYDPEFIEPYLEHYSLGEFTQEELQKNPEIQTDYITKCAKQIANQ